MAYNPEEDIKVSDLPEKTTDVVSDDKLLVIDSEDANILKQVDASKVKGSGGGSGDMLKSVYDKNNDGVVDNAEALGGVPASEYAKTADVQPTLKSGENIKTINGNSILGPGNIEIQGGTGTVDTAMSDTSTNAVQNKVIKAYVDSQSGGDGTTKTFVTDSTPDLVKGKEILDWYRAGKNPIIMISDKTYYLTYCDPAGTTDGKMVFSTTVGYENETWGDNTYYEITIRFNGTDEVNEVSGGVGTNGYLDTRIEYTTPYTPLYDGSPATKKYVDDAVAGGGGGYQVFALTGSYGSDAGQLNDTDYQTYLQAVEYLNNGGLALLSGMGNGYFYPYYNSGNYSGFIKSGYRDINQSTGTIILYKGSSDRVYIEKKIIARKGGFYQGDVCIDDIALTSGNRDYNFTMGSGAGDIANYVMLFGIKIERNPSGSSSIYLEDEVAGMIVGEGNLGYQNFVVGNTFSSSYEYNNQTKYGRITVNPILTGGVGEKTIRFTLNKSISDADTKAYFNFILIST